MAEAISKPNHPAPSRLRRWLTPAQLRRWPASLRRNIVPAILLLPVIFICGKLLLTRVDRPPEKLELDRISAVSWTMPKISERGWPWPFSQAITENVHEEPLGFFPLALLADLALLSAIVAIWCAILIRHHRRQASWLRFSIAEMLIAATAIAVPLGWLTNAYKTWQHAQQLTEHLQANYWHVEYPEYRGPNWLCRLLPKQSLTMFYYANYLQGGDFPQQLAEFPEALSGLQVTDLQFSFIRNSTTPATTDYIEHTPLRRCNGSALARLQTINLDRLAASDDALQFISTFPNVETLELYGIVRGPIFVPPVDHFTDRGVAALGNCPALQELIIEADKITDAGVTKLSTLRHLRQLILHTPEITDASLISLSKISTLEELVLTSCPKITDAGLRSLLALPNLRELVVSNQAKISPEMQQTLKSHIPDFRIY